MRIEFYQSRSSYFPVVVEKCKKLGTYSMREENGITVHSVEFSESQGLRFVEVGEMVKAWKGVAFFDGKKPSSFQGLFGKYVAPRFTIYGKKCPNCGEVLTESSVCQALVAGIDAKEGTMGPRVSLQCRHCGEDLSALSRIMHALRGCSTPQKFIEAIKGL